MVQGLGLILITGGHQLIAGITEVTSKPTNAINITVVSSQMHNMKLFAYNFP